MKEEFRTNNMKIAILLPSAGNSGGKKVIIYHSKELIKRGHQVTIFYPILISNVHFWRFSSFYETFKIFYWFLYGIFTKKVSVDNFNIRHRFIFSLIFIPRHFDIYIATWWETAFILNKIRLFNTHYLIQGYEIWNGKSNIVHKTYSYPFQIFTISQYLKIKIEKYAKTQIGIVYNPVKDKPTEFIPRNKKAFGVIYRRGKLKAFQNFILAIKNLPNKDKSLVYCLAINLPSRYRKYFSYVFQGSLQEEVRTFYSTISLLVIPSFDEGFSLPVIEALSYSCIVMIKKIGIASDLLNNNNSFLLDSNLPHDINKSLSKFLELQQDLFQSMQEQSYNIYLEYSKIQIKSENDYYDLFKQ
jgi:hypothetical protein